MEETMESTDCPQCASERAQSRAMGESLNEFVDALRGVRAYADECMSRAGAQVDVAEVAASLAPFLSGRALPTDLQLAARLSLLERAAEEDHPATVRLHVRRLGEMLKERGLL